MENTKKQRQDQVDKHKPILEQIDSLKQFLKSEVANRKEAEIHFEKLIETRLHEIEEQFNIRYLNSLYQMRDRIKQFEQRQQKLEVKAKEIRSQIDGNLIQQKQELVVKVSQQESEFSLAYHSQIEEDVRELKYIGELEYNFDNMVTQINQHRASDYEELLGLIDESLNDGERVHKEQEKTRKIVFTEINNLKMQLKLEIDSRKQADEDIRKALEKYQ